MGFESGAVPGAGELARYRLAAQHPLTREWVDDGLRLDLLTAECEDDRRLATDLDLARRRAERFAPGHPPSLLLDRWVEVGDGLSVMLGMRHEGLDVTRPFVDASLTTRPVQSRDLPALRSAATGAYGVLRPRYLRLWDARGIGAIAGTGPDRRQLAAPLADLRAGPPPPAGLGLHPAATASRRDRLVAAYADVDADHPGHERQAVVQPQDDLDAAAAAGTLFEVLLDGDWAGYVGAVPEGDTLGMPAWVVLELALAPVARGHGLGRHLSTMLARGLPDERPVLVGTVHADNRGARAAALTAGRHDVGGWARVPLPAAAPAGRRR